MKPAASTAEAGRLSPLGKLQLIEAVMRADPHRLSLVRKAILTDLVLYADIEGRSWPSVGTLAGHAGVTIRPAQKQIAKLVAAGLIERTIRPGRNHTNLYRIQPSMTERLPQETPSLEPGFAEEKVSLATGFNTEKGVPGEQQKVSLETAKTRPQGRGNPIRESIRESAAAVPSSPLEEYAPAQREKAAAAAPLFESEEEDSDREQIREALGSLSDDFGDPIANQKPPDNTLIARLISQGRTLGAEPAEVGAWIEDAIEADGERIRGYGFFLRTIDDDLPAWLARRRAEPEPEDVPEPADVPEPEKSAEPTAEKPTTAPGNEPEPFCSRCRGWGCFEGKNGVWKRCDCRDGRILDEGVLTMRNRFRGKEAATSGRVQ